MNTALLIMDVQVGMFSDPEEQPYNGEAVLENIQTILYAARDAKIPVIFIKHTASRGELSRGMPTWEICAQISPLDTEVVIEKTSWDAFHNTNLNETLLAFKTNKLIITGLQTEFCVDTTCRRAYYLGYKSILASDAHTTFDSKILSGAQIVEHHNYILGGRFVSLKSTDDIIHDLKC